MGLALTGVEEGDQNFWCPSCREAYAHASSSHPRPSVSSRGVWWPMVGCEGTGGVPPTCFDALSSMVLVSCRVCASVGPSQHKQSKPVARAGLSVRLAWCGLVCLSGLRSFCIHPPSACPSPCRPDLVSCVCLYLYPVRTAQVAKVGRCRSNPSGCTDWRPSCASSNLMDGN